MKKKIFYLISFVVTLCTISILLIFWLGSIKVSGERTMWNIVSSPMAGFWAGKKISQCSIWVYENIINKTK
jgi:hypothetical protein